MSENTIIINKRYFNNIEKAVNSLNQFFASNFESKNLIKVDELSDLDEGIKTVLDSIDTVDSRWISDPELVADAADKINDTREEVQDYVMDKDEGGNDFLSYCEDKGDTSLMNTAKEFLSFKALEQIADNMPAFEKLLNGIYSFELFTKPSKYKKEVQTFTRNVPKGECSDVLGDTPYSVFNLKDYVNGLFDNEDVELPETMDIKNEFERVSSFIDLTGDTKVTVNESIQEAAEVNFFTDTRPSNIKYANGKWQISSQFEKTVDEFVSKLRGCNDLNELKDFMISDGKKYCESFNSTVAPFIVVQGLQKKTSTNSFSKYTDSYKSIVTKNGGAKRFENYDIFTTFKSDKEGTIKFISDFCKLKFVNDPKSRISNNTLLTLFNIFDSRIYFDIMYNMIPDKEKKDKGMDEDSFVRKHRATVNNNSRSSNPYQKEDSLNDTESTSGEIKEYVSDMIRSMGDMSTTDMMLCESWHDMLYEEIKTVDDGLYNAHIPASATYDYIGESFDVMTSVSHDVFMESVESRNNRIRNMVVGLLIGGAGVTTLLSVGAAAGLPVTLFQAATAGNVTVGTTAIVLSKIERKSRGKSIKSEIVRDTKSVITALSKEADEIDDYIIRDLKKRARILTETLSFATRRRDLFNDADREKLVDLHHASVNINKKLSAEDQEKNSSIIINFLKAADVVLRMITKINIENYEQIDENKSWDEPDEEEVTKTTEGESVESDEDDDDDDEELEDEPTQESTIQEVDDGSIPAYMRTRIKLEDEARGESNKPKIQQVDIPMPEIPSNPIDDLSLSIDAKVNAGGDEIEDIIGKEAKKEGTNIVYNITNNYTYTNSFNKTTHNDASTNKRIGNSTVNNISDKDASNNKYNSTGSSDTNEERKIQEFSTGYSVEDVFAFLNSEEPLLEASGTKLPKEDSLTRAMDRDRKTLPKQQAAKKAVNKAVGTAKAVTKPIVRTKHWLLGIVDSLVKRREDKVKAEIIQNPSYRTALFKACRIALKIGLTGVAFTISGYLGAAYLLLQASDAYDKQRLRVEVEDEFATEMKILDEKMRYAKEQNTPESRQALYHMMRLRSRMERIAAKDITRSRVKHPTAVQ